MKFSLRRAGPADESLVKALLAEEITLELCAADWPAPLKNQIIPMQVSSRYAAVHGGSSRGESFILQLDGQDAGWLYLADLESEVRLVEVLVSNRFRGNGAGTAAVRHTIERAGGRPVRLHVRAANPGARRLYERMGFRPISADEINVLMEYTAAPC
jgi:GNAT superfamily N-acetyltransferase